MNKTASANSSNACKATLVALRSIFTHVTVWLATMVLGPLAMIFTFIFPKKTVTNLGYLWSWIILKAAGVNLQIIGAENVPEGCAVMTGNHSSNFDIHAVILSLRPHYYRFVVKKELRWIPIFGWALWISRFPFVDRQRSPKARRVMTRLQERMRATSMKIVMFPEGTRNRRPGMLPFRKGAFVLAIDLGVPVVPMVISGARRVQSRHGFTVRPGQMSITFLEPIPTKGMTYADRDTLAQKVYDLIYERLDEDEKGAPAEVSSINTKD
jgi:1-acyl-sn-glycerol-3-phosphate acyltransferase